MGIGRKWDDAREKALGSQPPDVEYVPPKTEMIRAFSKRVCETLAVQNHDPAFIHPNAIRWLAEFLELAARVQAKHQNEQQSVDKEEQ